MFNLPPSPENVVGTPISSIGVQNKKSKAALIGFGVLSLVLFGANSASADRISFTATSGDYATPGNWSTGVVPGGADEAITNLNRTAIISSAVPTLLDLTAGNTPGSYGAFNVVAGASLTTTGRFRVTAGGTGNGSITQSGGVVIASGTGTNSFDVGNGTGGGTALYQISGGSLSVNSATAGTAVIGSTAGTGTFWVSGDTATIKFNHNLLLGATGKFQFTLAPTGVSQIEIANAFTLDSVSSMLVIDATAYTGGVGSLTLISSVTRTGTFALSNISITGIASGFSGAISYSGGNVLLNVSAVPEPGTFVLLGLGLGVIGWCTHRRRMLSKA